MAEGEVEQEYVQKPSGFEDLCSVALCILLLKKHLKGYSVHLHLWATSWEFMCLGHSWSTSSTVTLGGQSQSVRFPEVPITPDYVNLFTGPATGASCVKRQNGQRFPWSWRLLPRCGSSFSPPGFLCLLDANVYQLQFLVSGPQMPGAAWLGDVISFHCLILSNFGWFVEKDPLVVSFFSDVDYCSSHIEKKTLLPQQVLLFFGGAIGQHLGPPNSYLEDFKIRSLDEGDLAWTTGRLDHDESKLESCPIPSVGSVIQM